MYGEGISKEGDLLDLAVDKKIVDKSGTWFAFNGDRLGQGRENVKQFLKDNPETMKAIETRVRRELGLRRGGNRRRLACAGHDHQQLTRADQAELLASDRCDRVRVALKAPDLLAQSGVFVLHRGELLPALGERARTGPAPRTRARRTASRQVPHQREEYHEALNPRRLATPPHRDRRHFKA